MRRSVILLTLAVLVLAGGCERKEASDEPQVYDPSLDAPPSPIVANPDPLLLANQSEIAKNAPKRASAMPGPARPVAAAGLAPEISATTPPAQAGLTPAVAAGATEVSPQTVEAVKKTFLAMADTWAAKQIDKIPDLFVPEDATVFKPFLVIAYPLEDKARKLMQLIRQKLGPQLSPGLAQFVQTTEGRLQQEINKKRNRATVENNLNKSQFALQPDGKVIVSNGKEDIAFVQVNNVWKITLSQEQRLGVQEDSEFIRAVDRFYDSMLSGLQNGAITKDNADAQLSERAKTLMAPTMKKLQSSPAVAKLQKGEILFSSFFEGSGSAEGAAAPASAGPAPAPAATGAPSAAPTTPAASPPAAGAAPASGGDINSGRGPEKADEMKRSLLAPARRVYGGGS
jgi:hypothetical protein